MPGDDLRVSEGTAMRTSLTWRRLFAAAVVLAWAYLGMRRPGVFRALTAFAR